MMVAEGELLNWFCESDTPRHATLFDPANQSPEEAALKAKIVVEVGSKLILIGGSTDTPSDLVHATVVAIKKVVDVPVVLFPGGAHALSPSADGILFMMLMNSNNPRFLIGEQVKGATWLYENGIEMLPTAYLICEPGGKVGEVGNATPLTSPEEVISYSLCAKGYGMKIVYLEAGSGAAHPVHADLIKVAHSDCLIVGGGIRTKEDVRNAVESGADWIVTGTLVEEYEIELLAEKLKPLILHLHK
jgi:phosphoglycerol geranylgeranyltransferase